MNNDKDLSDFFKSKPLYSKTKLFSKDEYLEKISLFEYFADTAYKFYCPIDKEEHTFKTLNNNGIQEFLSKEDVDYYMDKDGKFSFSFHIESVCSSCGFKMDFLINLFSETKIDEDGDEPDIFVRKIGQFPAVERMPEKEVYDYLNDEDKENYKKALSNLSVSYGIGAFAYLRRIIENEIKRIVKDISQLDFDGSENVILALEEYEQSHQMSNLIKNINPYIPQSLKEIGTNPIKLLYEQLSGGIHEFSEEECLTKATEIDIVLRYVIKKVNSEKYEIKSIKEAIKKLEK